MIEILLFFLASIPLLGAWASWKFWQWHKFYGTRFLWGLFLSSAAADLASVPVAFLAARRLILGPGAPPFPESATLVAFSLLILEGIFVYLVFRWNDLDDDMKRARNGPEDESSHTNLPPYPEPHDIDRGD